LKPINLFWIIGGVLILVGIGCFDPSQHRFPQCPVRYATGWLCPGCGSQRAIHEALNGHFLAAFRLNALFLPAVIYALAGVVTTYLFPSKWQFVRARIYGKYAAYIALMIILIYWIGRNIW
jgi:hypothetical protein